MNRAGWMVGVVVAMGCTPLPEAPRLRADAMTATGDMGTPVVDVEMVDRGIADDRVDAGSVVDADVFEGETSTVDADVTDITDVVDVVDVLDVTDVPTDVDAGVVTPSGPRLVGGFVSSAVVGSTRLSGGFTWGSAVNSPRLEGWLR